MSQKERKAIPDATLVSVLLKCRRRCCLCFGLNSDLEIKKGQISHLDRNPANSNEDNLVFLCLVHHDEYDSRASQSKNLMENEVKRYRDALHRRFETQEDATPITIAAVSPQLRRPVYPPLDYQTTHLEGTLQRMRKDGRKEFSLYDFETFLMTQMRDNRSLDYEPLTIWSVREAIERFIREGRLTVTENSVILP